VSTVSEGAALGVQLVMFTSGGAGPAPGLLSPSGQVFGLAAAAGLAEDAAPADLLAVIVGWDRLEEPVRAAMARVRSASAGEPVADARLSSPFPRPLRDAFAIGGNYRQHVVNASVTTGVALTERKGAVFFMKPVGSFAGPSDDVEFDPALTERLDYEVELGIVLGVGGRDIAREQSMDHVFGYLVVNDFSARDVMLRNKPQIDHFRGKGMDTFFPMGPGITLASDVEDYRELRLLLSVNGEPKQDCLAADMTRDVPEIVAELSKGMSLYAGDIIATGTPAGVAQESPDPVFLADGDVVETRIVGLGTLTNRVRARGA
jgi:2-keto-4-pentenoate hydratase/2-oxohepta-3-ene-1,7-dioic acid hydratase in catechol pathway